MYLSVFAKLVKLTKKVKYLSLIIFKEIIPHLNTIMPHTCPHCDRIFSQKGHLEKHLNKKKTCEKCNVSFTSQYAYINDEYIHVKDYEKNKGDKIKCARGHELVLCNGNKIRKYFRHKKN